MSMLERIGALVQSTLQLRGPRLAADSPLLGALPELDSMAVLNLLLALEQQFSITIADDEIRAEHFATLATLSAFVQEKLA